MAAQQPISVTGTFAFDGFTTDFSKFDVTLQGDAAIAGVYTDTSNPVFGNDELGRPTMIFGALVDTDFLEIHLSMSWLGDPWTFEIVDGFWLTSKYPGTHYYLSPRDGDPRPTIVGSLAETTVPEPSTWAMMLGAFASAAAWTRGRKVHLRD